jgi:hypothetical protein
MEGRAVVVATAGETEESVVELQDIPFDNALFCDSKARSSLVTSSLFPLSVLLFFFDLNNTMDSPLSPCSRSQRSQPFLPTSEK